MGSTTAPRPSSYFLPSPPSSASVPEPAFIVARPRTTATSRTSVTSHYRPFSTYYHPGTEEPHYPLKRRRSSVFVSSATGLSSFGNMVFKHKDKDLDHPPHPSSPATRPRKDSDLTSSTRFKIPKTLRKKRSIAASLASDVTIMPHTPTVSLSTDGSLSSSPASPTEEKSPRTGSFPADTADPENDDDDDGEDSAKPPKYRKKDTWSRNDYGLKLHPYPKEAPYMRAYDSIYIDIDRWNNELLQRLLPKNSPSFRNYGNTPPRSVIDLGCGPGFWILDAAAAWKNTSFVGFDLVDVLQPGFQQTENVRFVRGNFVAYPLPFPTDSFDMVRMANLSLCIPYEKWNFVLSEAYRVLAEGGRLELIDDQIFFPYAESPSQFPASISQHSSKKPQQSSFIDLDDDDEDDEESGESGSEEHSSSSLNSDLGSDPAETLVGDDDSMSSSSSLKEHSSSRHVSVDLSPRDCPPSEESCILQVTLAPPKPWNTLAAESRELETVFETMLANQYGIHPRPSEFILHLMKDIFGAKLAGKMKSMHLKVAPTELSAEKKKFNLITGDIFKKLSLNIEWKDREKKKNRPRRNTSDNDSGSESRTSSDTCASSSDSGQETISAKAASTLGISMSEVSAASKEASARRPTSSPETPNLDRSGQPEGLLLWPRTFLPFSSSDLEMHCCINVHTLLGCKAALGAWVKGFVDESGKRVISRSEFEDSIWSYECFRRHRFNWPTGLPSSKCPSTDSIELPLKPTASSDQDATDKTLEYPYSQNELTHVRTIRVFEGIKPKSSRPSSLQ